MAYSSSRLPKVMTRLFFKMVHTLLGALHQLWTFLLSLFVHKSTISLDTGRTVTLGPLLSQGGFSFVFSATDQQDNHHTTTTYALKRIHCPEEELIQQARKEAAVHRAVNHPNCMPLLGFAVQGTDCYMLFPFLPHSLRLKLQTYDYSSSSSSSSRPPIHVFTALHLLTGIVRGVQALHRAQHSHQDVKIDNILLHGNTPVLMDFGSAGPLTRQIPTRRDILQVLEHASIHTTMSYRPPELWEHSSSLRPGDAPVDYRAVDVYALACTLFAILYGNGASPCECEITHAGQLRNVDCSLTKVLSGVPVLHGPMQTWYDPKILQLIVDMMNQNRQDRPTIAVVLTRIDAIIADLGGRPLPPVVATSRSFDDDDDGIALLSTNRLI